MANTIFNDQVSENSFLQMSNSGTSVFISLLAIATSRNAITENEKLMATCISSRDQSVFGIGVVGFDIAELPWSLCEEEFNELKIFLKKSIERVISRRDWRALSYEPDAERAVSNQHKFLEMVNSFQFKHVQKFNPKKFYLPEVVGELCQEHNVYLHEGGCVICNDE